MTLCYILLVLLTLHYFGLSRSSLLFLVIVGLLVALFNAILRIWRQE